LANFVFSALLIAALGPQCARCNMVIARPGQRHNCVPLQQQADANNGQQQGGGNGAPGGLAQPVGQHPGQHLLPTGIDQNATSAIAQLYESVFSPANGVQIPLNTSIDPDALPPSPFLFKKLPQAQAFLAHVLLTANAAFDAHNPISDKLFWYALNYAPSKLAQETTAARSTSGQPRPAPTRTARRTPTPKGRQGNVPRLPEPSEPSPKGLLLRLPPSAREAVQTTVAPALRSRPTGLPRR
jgi:hypothetical protein